MVKYKQYFLLLLLLSETSFYIWGGWYNVLLLSILLLIVFLVTYLLGKYAAISIKKFENTPSELKKKSVYNAINGIKKDKLSTQVIFTLLGIFIILCLSYFKYSNFDFKIIDTKLIASLAQFIIIIHLGKIVSMWATEKWQNHSDMAKYTTQ